MRVAIYARVSTDDQTCEQQLTALREYCLARQWQVAGEYVDTGYSGRKVARPAYQAMMDAARRRQLDCVIVWKMDRLGRSVQNLIHVIQELTSCGVRFIAVTQGIDTDQSNPASTLLLHLLAAFAEFESAIISERTIAGMRRAQAHGTRLGTPRKAVDFDKVFELHLAGKSLREIAKECGIGHVTVMRLLRGIGRLKLD